MRTKAAGISEFIRHKFVRIVQGITAVLVLILIIATVQAQEVDFLLRGGHGTAPNIKINSKMDVAIVADKIFSVASNIPASSSENAIDIGGLYLTPGLIDMHTHVFHGTDPNSMTANSYGGLQADAFFFRAGVTTVVDAGSSGWRNFPLFNAQSIDRAQPRVLAFLNVVGHGMLSRFDQQDMILRTTRNSEQVVQRPDLGHLIGSSEADIAVSNLKKENFGYMDVRRAKISGTEKLESELTLRAGHVVWDLNGISVPEWQMPAITK